MMADPTRHARRYARRFTLSIVAYVVLLILAIVLANRLDGAARVAVMLLPVPAIVAVAWSLLRFLVDSDEMIRRDQLTALALAFGLGSIITFTYGLLEVVGAPGLSWLWVWPVYAASWLLAHVILRIRSR